MQTQLKNGNLQAVLFTVAGLLHLHVGLTADRSGFVVAGTVFLCAASMIHRRRQRSP